MKKRLVILLILAIIFVICACNSSPEPSQTPSPEPWQGGALDLNEPYYADGLNDYGLPDLSVYSADQIWDMFTHPENWAPDVLLMSDGTFAFEETEEDYSDPEIDEDYIFGFCEWADYDPGDWTPAAEEYTQFDIDWSGEGEDYDPSVLTLPEEYSFLVPGGVRSGDVVINDEDGLNISLSNRTADEYAAVVQAVKDHGYTEDASSGSFGGLQYYSAGNGTEEINISYQNSTVYISI